MNWQPANEAEWRQACHLYYSLLRELLYCVETESLVMSGWISRARSIEMGDLLTAAKEAIDRAPFQDTEGAA